MPTLLNDGEIHGWTKTVIGEWFMKDPTAAASLTVPAGSAFFTELRLIELANQLLRKPTCHQ